MIEKKAFSLRVVLTMDFSDFDGEFQPIKELSKNEVKRDKMLTGIRKQSQIVRKRKATRHFFNTFKLYRSEGVDEDDGEDEEGDEEGEEGEKGDESEENGEESEKGDQTIDEEGDEEDERETEPNFITPLSPIEHIQISKFLETIDGLSDYETIRSVIMQKLTKEPFLDHLHDKYKELYGLIENTVNYREGNSALVIGPRAGGKTSLIDKCLEEVASKYNQPIITVRLSSLQSEESATIRQIANQIESQLKAIGLELSLETRSITLTFKNFMNILSAIDKSQSLSIVFIIDEFEHFTQGKKQVLLYNLFELTASASVPICIIGTSTKFTTRELLEKRVRSRFSQRLILFNKLNLNDFKLCCSNNLKLPIPIIDRLQDKTYGIQWNQRIDDLMNNPISELLKLIMLNFNTVKNLKHFNNHCIPAVKLITPENCLVDDKSFKLYHSMQMHNPIQAMIKSLSDLEVLLVIASARWIEKYNLNSINFNLAYNEYVDMLKQLNLDLSYVQTSSLINYNVINNIKVNTKIWNQSTLKNCWISLYKLGLLIDFAANTAEGGQKVQTSNKAFMVENHKMLQLDIHLAEIRGLLDDNEVFKKLTKL